MKMPGGTARVLIGLVLGAVVGLSLPQFSQQAAERAAAIAQPIGKLWLSGLQMTVVPLVVSLIVLGVASAANAAASGRIARRALGVFVAMLALFAAFAAIAAPALLSFLTPSPSLAATLRDSASHVASAGAPPGLADWVSGAIPSNAILAAAQGAMLPLVVFAMFLGFALTKISAESRQTLITLFQGVSDAMIVIVRWMLLAAPIGVFALVLVVCTQAGVAVIGALATYIGLLCALYLAAVGICYVIALLFGAANVRRFASGILPAQIVAASTQSSLATLPTMVESAQRIGLPRNVAALSLPMAVTLFRITSPIQYIAAAAFVAWAYGIELTALQLAGAAALSVAISLGSVGLPGQAIFAATVIPVSQSLGLPMEPMGLLLAVDAIPDVFATVGNVTGDLTAANVVSRGEAEDEVVAEPHVGSG
ncbi:MAG: cation:dicarboxylase symporter family transporter [Lysobacteraceae bacterium]